MLEEFGPSLYTAEGPTVSFYGFPYPTRMAVVRLSDGGAWVWSPVALTDELANSVEAIGPVRHIVSPNKIHHSKLRRSYPHALLPRIPGEFQEQLDSCRRPVGNNLSLSVLNQQQHKVKEGV